MVVIVATRSTQENAVHGTPSLALDSQLQNHEPIASDRLKQPRLGSRPVNEVSGAGTSLISDHDADALELKKGSNSGEPKITLGYPKSREA
jgi:hypothetical protein